MVICQNDGFSFAILIKKVKYWKYSVNATTDANIKHGGGCVMVWSASLLHYIVGTMDSAFQQKNVREHLSPLVSFGDLNSKQTCSKEPVDDLKHTDR